LNDRSERISPVLSVDIERSRDKGRGALRDIMEGKKKMGPDAYKEKILNELVRRFDKNRNSLPDAYALIWAIDAYASVVWFATDKKNKVEEQKFKDKIQDDCEEFEIIRSASNAIKHIERSKDGFIVNSMVDINAGEGATPHAWSSNGGSSAPSVSITMNWNYYAETQEYSYDMKGKDSKLTAPKSGWKTQYLYKLYKPAIDAIDKKWSCLS
jgi:hypothetical protein